jgi:hypothetical protein
MPYKAHLQTILTEYWAYAISWVIITLEWSSAMPEWVGKVLCALATGFALAAGKWAFEKLQKHLRI